jgi:glycerophosphoryl diester phosphodiesterase
MTLSRPLLLGHRGARATVGIPENTLASFDLCLEHGCDGFEFDVRQTASGAAVVCHDEVFRGLELGKASAPDLAHWQAQGFLPTLEQVLQRFYRRCFLDVELKDPGLEEQIIDLLRRYTPVKGCVVTSFQPNILGRLHELDPVIDLGFLFDQSSPENIALCHSLPVPWVLPELGLLDQDLASSFLAGGKHIGVWTVNSASDMVRLSTVGAEMLISDDTARLANTFRVG